MHDDPSELDPNEPSAGKPQKSSAPKTGCVFVSGLISGFILFFVIGAAFLRTFRSSDASDCYLIVSVIVAIWLATKPSFSGFAIGIFLGLGATLLLVSICGGRGPMAP
jgi:hypothetical protein